MLVLSLYNNMNIYILIEDIRNNMPYRSGYAAMSPDRQPIFWDSNLQILLREIVLEGVALENRVSAVIMVNSFSVASTLYYKRLFTNYVMEGGGQLERYASYK